VVTAIVIPIICLYFFLITRKELKEHDIKWLAAGEVRHEASLTGEIKDISSEKQRFYYHRYLFVQELKLQTGLKLIKVKKIIPIQKNVKIEEFHIGDIIRVYGSWERSQFLFNNYEIINSDINEQ
jgi:hypothetical protein